MSQLDIPEDAELVQVHVVADTEGELLAEFETELSDREAYTDRSQRIVQVTRGGPQSLPDGRDYAIAGEDRLQRTVFRDANRAVGYFFHWLEMSDVDEPAASEEFWDLVVGYNDWRESLTEQNRKQRLVTIAIDRAKNGDYIAAHYLNNRENFSFHETGIADADWGRYEEMLDDDRLHPRVCYSNAHRLASEYADDDRVEYAEGLAMPETLGQVTRHAWLLIDGRVAEVTWPGHFSPDQHGTYMGTTIPIAEVEQIRDRRMARYGMAGALYPPDGMVVEAFSQMGTDADQT
jgi:hypothetical protein